MFHKTIFHKTILLLGICCFGLSLSVFGQSDEEWLEFQAVHLATLIEKTEEGVYKDKVYPLYIPLLKKMYQKGEVIRLIEDKIPSGKNVEEELASVLWTVAKQTYSTLDNVDSKFTNAATPDVNPDFFTSNASFYNHNIKCKVDKKFRYLHQIVNNYYDLGKKNFAIPSYTNYQIKPIEVIKTDEASFEITFKVNINESCYLKKPVVVKVNHDDIMSAWTVRISQMPIRLNIATSQVEPLYREVEFITIAKSHIEFKFKKYFDNLEQNMWLEEEIDSAEMRDINRKEWHLKGFFLHSSKKISKDGIHIQQATNGDGVFITVPEPLENPSIDKKVDSMTLTLKLPLVEKPSCLEPNEIKWVTKPKNYTPNQKIPIAFRFNAEANPKTKLYFYPMGGKSGNPKRVIEEKECNQLIEENYITPEESAGNYIFNIKGKDLNEFITISPTTGDDEPRCPDLQWVERPAKGIYHPNDKLYFSFDYNRKLVAEANAINKAKKRVLLTQVFPITSPNCRAIQPQKHTFSIPENAEAGLYQLRVKVYKKGEPEPHKSISHTFEIKQRCIDSLAWANNNMKKKYQEGDYVNVQFNVNNDETCLINDASYESPPRTNPNCLVSTRTFSGQFPIGKHKISITAHGNKTIKHRFKVIKKLSDAEAKKRKIRRRLWGGIGGGSGLVTLLTILLTPNRSIAY